MQKNSLYPSIYAYNDFRKFLADYQCARFEQDKSFTKSEFSRKLQLPNTRSYFTDVLKGKFVSETFIERFISVIGFDHDEAQFFKILVRFNQTDKTEERELLFEQLIALNRTPSRLLDLKILHYYNTWYNGVIRAMLEIEEFTDDYTQLARKIRLPVTSVQARKAVNLLLELGLVNKNENGIIKPTDKAIRAPEEVKKELFRSYHLQCMECSKKSLINDPEAIVFSLINTLSISEQGYQRLRILLEKFQSQIRSLVHKDEDAPDRVLQINLVLNKLTK